MSENTQQKGKVAICDGKIIGSELVGVKESAKYPTIISAEAFEALIADLKDCLLYIQGEKTSSYDNSDDDRVESSSHSWSFGHYFEIEPWENSKHLLRINGKIRGVVFHISSGSEVSYYAFLFDNSIKRTLRMGYSASHSSSYTYVEQVSLVKRGKKGAPETGSYLRYEQNEMYPSF